MSEVPDDILVGGFGNDILTGGDGADTFVTAVDNDLIVDYSKGEGDILDLSHILSVRDTIWRFPKAVTERQTVRHGRGKQKKAVSPSIISATVI